MKAGSVWQTWLRSMRIFFIAAIGIGMAPLALADADYIAAWGDPVELSATGVF